MARTMFVNPRRRKGKRKSRGRGRRTVARRGRRSRAKKYTRVKSLYRRNAGISSFIQNPLIMSPNPHRRRRGRSNPLMASFNLKSIVTRTLTFGGGAAISVAANTLFLNSVEDFMVRNGLRLVGAIGASAVLKGELGAATAGSMFYPLMQELAAKFLGGTTTATEADMESLAADLEDVMEDLDESDLSDDDDDILG